MDNSDLFFILPKGTQFPYTLSEDEKTKFEKARFLILNSSSSESIFVLSPEGLLDPLNGTWAGVYNSTGIVTVSVTKGSIGAPGITNLSDKNSVHFTTQTLTDEQQEQARKNIGVQTEYVFEDIDKNERSMYAYNGLIFYRNSNGKLSSFNEQTFETVSYDKITFPSHSYFGNVNSSVKRFIVKNDKILTFKMYSDAIILWDLNTQEKIYEATPLSANNQLWHSGKFIEFNGKIFLSHNMSAEYGVVEIDLDTGSVVKTISALNGIILSQYNSYFSYENEELSLFVIGYRIIKYNKSTDEFSILVDASPSVIEDENINVTKGKPSCIFKCPQNDTEILIFTPIGLCVNLISDVLLGKFNSTRNFVEAHGFRSDKFEVSSGFIQFSANEFISNSVQVSLLNTFGGYTHTFGMSINADFNRLGYFTKGELGVVFNRGYNNGFKVDTLPIYRRYGNDIH